MKEFERYLKALIEAYGTTEGKPLNLDEETVLKWGKKLRSIIADEIIDFNGPN